LGTGCRSSFGHYAVDVPPDADWEQAYAYLAAQEEKGVLGWQSSWRGERPDVA
jgi:hypothetical protein